MDTRVQAFRDLHASGCFVMPNPWDAGSARLFASLGFRALATTSAGMAWSKGARDNGVALPDVLAHLETMARAVPVPMNADFEGGFATDPDGRMTFDALGLALYDRPSSIRASLGAWAER
jgi:methylisocitrate lyase